MRRTLFSCDRCGVDITNPDFRNIIKDDSFVFVIEHMPHHVANKPAGFHTTAKIDLCYDCYKIMSTWFGVREDE